MYQNISALYLIMFTSLISLGLWIIVQKSKFLLLVIVLFLCQHHICVYHYIHYALLHIPLQVKKHECAADLI